MVRSPEEQPESCMDGYARFISEEYGIESPELVGEPVSKDTGGATYVFSDPEKDYFVFFTNGPEYHQGTAIYDRAQLEGYGSGNLIQGITRAIKLLDDPRLGEEDEDGQSYFFKVTEQIG